MNVDCQLANKDNESERLKSLANDVSVRSRPFACHICNKKFTQKAHLIIHRRVHTGEKPYSCHICHRKFAQSSHLTVHKRVHTGEKPFFCNFCGLGFSRRPRLEAHILQHVAVEGKPIPSNMKDDSLKNVSVAGLKSSNSAPIFDGSHLVGLELKDEFIAEIKTEPLEVKTDSLNDNESCNNNISEDQWDQGIGNRKSRKPKFVRKLENRDHITHYDQLNGLIDSKNKDINMLGSVRGEMFHRQTSIDSNMPDEMSLSRLAATSGLVGTNSCVSLLDFTTEDILQHLMSREDVRSCTFCCIIFHDPAMYYLHRSMHEKMDNRCCNLCGKQLVDKYDFTAHFLHQHK